MSCLSNSRAGFHISPRASSLLRGSQHLLPRAASTVKVQKQNLGLLGWTVGQQLPVGRPWQILPSYWWARMGTQMWNYHLLTQSRADGCKKRAGADWQLDPWCQPKIAAVAFLASDNSASPVIGVVSGRDEGRREFQLHLDISMSLDPLKQTTATKKWHLGSSV